MNHSLTQLWTDALRDVIVRHPNGRSNVVLRLIDGTEPSLYFGLDATTCTSDPTKTMRDFSISTVRLTYFPGVRLARMWLAAAFSGYCQHETLELVTVGNLHDKVLDPHAEPFTFDRGLRDGLPVVLTPETLLRTLCVVMERADAEALVNG